MKKTMKVLPTLIVSRQLKTVFTLLLFSFSFLPFKQGNTQGFLKADGKVIKNEKGIEKQYAVEALFDMRNQTYALLQSNGEVLLMRVEDEKGEQYLVGLTDSEERDSILDAYQIAVEATPADEEFR